MRNTCILVLLVLASIARAESNTPRRQQLAADDPYHLDRAGPERGPEACEPAVLPSGGMPSVLHRLCPTVRRLIPRKQLANTLSTAQVSLDFAGRTLAVCDGRTVQVRDVETGRVILEQPASWVELSGDGKTALTTRNFQYNALDVASGRSLWTRRDSCTLVPVGADLFLTGDPDLHRLIDARDGRVLDTHKLAHDLLLLSGTSLECTDGDLYTTPPHPTLLSREQGIGLVTAVVDVWRLAPEMHECRFTDGGRHAIVMGYYIGPKLVDVDDARHARAADIQPLRRAPTWGGSVIPGGRYMVAHCATCAVAVFDLVDGREIADAMPKAEGFWNMAVSGDGRTACGVVGSDIQIFDLSDVIH